MHLIFSKTKVEVFFVQKSLLINRDNLYNATNLINNNKYG